MVRCIRGETMNNYKQPTFTTGIDIDTIVFLLLYGVLIPVTIVLLLLITTYMR